jgi:hypothetical protein
MRTWLTMTLVVLVGVLAFTWPTQSQEQERARIGAMVDVTPITRKLDVMTDAVLELKKQNAEMAKSLEETKKALVSIAAASEVMVEPAKWEYVFRRRVQEKQANEFGQHGWELVTIDDENHWYVFRRRATGKADGAVE